MRPRALWLLVAALAAVAAACAAFVLLRPAVEAEARARIEDAARRASLSATLGSVRLTPRLSLELRDVVLENAGRVRLMTREATVRPRLSFRAPGRAARVSLGRATVELPLGLQLELSPSTWDVESGSRSASVRRVEPGEHLELDVSRGLPGHVQLRARATNARLSRLVRILLHGCPVVDPGTVDGDLRLQREPRGIVRLAVRGRARGLAVASWTTGGTEGCDPSMGAPTDAELQADAQLDARAGSARADRFRVVAGGAEMQGRLAVDGGLDDPRVDIDVRVPRVDLARLLATAGLDRPADDLGWASLTASVSGPLLDPAALHVDERLDFHPPARPLPAIERLKGPFVHRAVSRDGTVTLVRVAPDSPDFIPLAEVPPLFLRTLLIGEDADFYGHPGIDLKEIPVALATDLAAGTFARGASTIEQQLAKNLFLTREKTVSRKLEELALALLIGSSLGKSRVLEIYVNVIEWGPHLYGLRPAARHYFGEEPGELTPKQMAFLVALVPGPVKYQRSFPGGTPTPFLEGRMATLLAKLHSVGALSDEEYERALAAPLDLLVPGPAEEGGTPWPPPSPTVGGLPSPSGG
jgi:hypothetical protein